MMSNYPYDRIQAPIALVAEDDDRVRGAIATHLREKGYGVLEAKTSVEALLMAVDYPGRIDALFTSLELRKFCNGAELAGCLRMTRPDISVFYLGGAEDCSEEVTRELFRGQAVLLKKPVSKSRLDDAIGMLEENRAWAEATLRA